MGTKNQKATKKCLSPNIGSGFDLDAEKIKLGFRNVSA